MNITNKYELFQYIVNWIESHPEEVEEALKQDMEEYTKDFTDVDTLNLGDRNVFIMPSIDEILIGKDLIWKNLN